MNVTFSEETVNPVPTKTCFLCKHRNIKPKIKPMITCISCDKLVCITCTSNKLNFCYACLFLWRAKT